jgi:UDP-N-acetylmuramyl-tripeptide synthetase
LNAHFDSPAVAASWLKERVGGKLHTDSRLVCAGDGFIAWPGAATDGRRYVKEALAAGATACLVESDGAQAFGFDDERVASYSSLKAATGPIAASYFDSPSTKLDVIAVTGTNGKTSTTWMLAQALKRLGHRCGVIGTLGIGEPGALLVNGLTTPDPVVLQAALRDFVQGGFVVAAVEASSIGLVERRLDAVAIRIAIFTNFTQDHLDFHGSMQAYWQAKRSLFDWPGLQAAVVNVDDLKGFELADELSTRESIDVWTVSIEGESRLSAQALQYGRDGLAFNVVERGGSTCRMQTQMVGEYNVSNLLGALGALRALGISLDDAVAGCIDLIPVPGRMDRIDSANAPLVVIDYAHTPDALEKVLMALKPLAESRSGQLWCLFGCGGERDAGKRPIMGALAEKYADRVVVTSDNPRGERPMAVIDAITSGFSRQALAVIEPDRAAAIALSILRAGPSDVVLLAGKGHENYQDVGGQKRPFSDHAHARIALDARHTRLQAAGSAA